MRPKQCSLRAPNLRERERERERTRKEGEQNTQEKERRERGKSREALPPVGSPPAFLCAIRRRHPDITPTHPYVLPPSSGASSSRSSGSSQLTQSLRDSVETQL